MNPNNLTPGISNPPENIPEPQSNIAEQPAPIPPTFTPPPQGVTPNPGTTPQFSGVQAPPPNLPPMPVNWAQLQSSGGKGKWVVLSIVIGILVILGGLSAYAYYQQIWPFAHAPYNVDTLTSNIIEGLGKINTSTYALHLNIASQAKEADAKPFDLSVNDTDEIRAYKRDLDKVRDLQNILQSLDTYYYSNHKNKYPASIPKTTGIPSSRLSDYTYASKANFGDFSLTVQFESTAAVTAIQKFAKLFSSNASSTIISGKTVTFSKDSQRYLSIPSEPPQPFLISILNMQQYLAYIPSDFELDGQISGTAVKSAENALNSEIHLSGGVNFGDLNASVDAQMKKIGDNLYLMISKFPSIVGNISKIKDKWIIITPQDIATYGSGYLGVSSKSSDDQVSKTKERAIQQVKIFLNIADKDHALTIVKDPVVETVDGVRAYRYELEFNKDNIAQFYKDLCDEFANSFKDNDPLVFDKATLDYLQSTQFSQAFDYFRNNTTLVLWARSDGIPVEIMYKLRMVPDANAKNADRQIMTTISLSLSKINEPITIDAPNDSISVEDATILITGQSKEVYEFNKQQSTIQSIRNALSAYKETVGTYPDSLNDLIKTALGANGSFTPYLKTMPSDVFTDKPFAYKNNGFDYTLSYSIQLPPYVKGTIPARIYEYDYANINYSSVKRPILMKAVNDTNTADSKTMSEEAVTQSKIDSDGDGLPDVLERYLGTNPNKKDSDGDGYSDYDELMSGSDPLGPGKLKATGNDSY